MKGGTSINHKDVCRVLGISQKTYYNKYNGVTQFTLEEVLKLMEYFDMSFEEILEILKKRKGKGE